MTRIRSLAALLCVASLAACEKNAVQDITRPITGGAFIRFQNYGVNVPGVNFYANDQKVTAISSAACSPPPTTPVAACTTTGVEAVTGVGYGLSANGANYSMLAPGQYTVTSRIAAVLDNGLPVSTASTALTDGKFYTYYVSGIYDATAKKSDAFIVEDNLPTSFDYSKAYIRLVNASSNAPSASATVQLQTSAEVATVASNVAYKGVTPFITIAPGLSDIVITLSNGVVGTFRSISLNGGHVYTIGLRGDASLALNTTNALAITVSANR